MSKKIKILIADDVDISPFDNFPKSKFNIEKNIGISYDAILSSDCDALVIRSNRKLNKKFINNFRGKVIATFSKGLDHIDMDESKRGRVKVVSANEGNSQSAAEHTLALMLSAAKNLVYSDKLIRTGKFNELDYKRNELYGKKVGIIGYGSIGKRVAKLCKAFDMIVYANDTDRKVIKSNKKIAFKSLNYILINCDIITIHIPLDKKNVNFISKEKLSILKRDSIFINTSRGELVDEKYLIKTLEQKRIGFAGIDVFKDEPNINSLFFKLDNVILTNHIAGKTIESKQKIAIEVAGKLLKFLENMKQD
jgi:phosphoglycerate dehydrogenase-like enzyme